MRYFPLFLDTRGRKVLVLGAGEAAAAKLRLLARTEARLTVIGDSPAAAVTALAEAGRVRLLARAPRTEDVTGAGTGALVWVALEDRAAARRLADAARRHGALVNVVDDPAASDLVTPAIVDRDPVVVAIGTEGTAPVLARRLKARLEALLPTGLGRLAQAAGAFRRRAEALPPGRARRAFWAEFFDRAGPRALARGDRPGLPRTLEALLARHLHRAPGPGRVDIVGAGPGSAELLTLAARRALDEADVVLTDRLVADEILELARREALILPVGKEGHGPATAQEEIIALMISHARAGRHVVRLKGGDPAVFGRVEEEVEALAAAGIDWRVIPGITAASAAVAGLGLGLSRRGRNREIRLLTGHDARGVAEHDWASLARPGTVAVVYMARRAARVIQGRLLMHGADLATPVTLVVGAGRPDAQALGTTLGRLPDAVASLAEGPMVMLIGLAAPRPGKTTGHHQAHQQEDSTWQDASPPVSSPRTISSAAIPSGSLGTTAG